MDSYVSDGLLCIGWTLMYRMDSYVSDGLLCIGWTLMLFASVYLYM